MTTPSSNPVGHEKAQSFRDFGHVSIAPIGARARSFTAAEILCLFVAKNSEAFAAIPSASILR